MYLHPFYFLDREVISNGCYDYSLHEFLKSYIKPGMVALDVGANIGEVTLHLSKLVGNNGVVYAFEPVPMIISRLVENIKLNNFASNVILESDALSNENGTATFAAAEANIENQGMGSLVNQDNEVVNKTFEVKTIRLDDFVQKNSIKSIDFIKIDIQGAEIAFLEGAMETIEKMSPDMVLEISASDLAHVSKTPKDLLVFLEKLGYTICLFDKNGISNTQVTSEEKNVNLSLNVFCTKKPRVQ